MSEKQHKINWLRDQLNNALPENAELLKDKERLDWLLKKTSEHSGHTYTRDDIDEEMKDEA